MIAIVEAARAGLLQREHWARNLAAGLVVGIVALPLAMAFAMASGVKPEQGIYTSIVAGLAVSLFGGSRIQIAGPTGAFVVILAAIVAKFGVDGLLLATIMAGAMLVLFGAARFGGVLRFIPEPVIAGFTAGIGVVIWVGQWKDFFGLPAPTGAHFHDKLLQLLQSLPGFHPATTLLAALSLALAVFAPRIPGLARVPGPLVAMIVATVLQASFGFEHVATIKSAFGGIPLGLPHLALPEASIDRILALVPAAFTIAMLGAIESLLCARVADNATDFPRHDPNQELMAQGVANFVTPFFGGIPATGTIARTVTNVRSGATSPVAGMVHSATLLVVVLAAAPLAANVPLAALAGILLFVSWNMGEWREFARLRHFSVPYRTIMLGTFFLTVVFDLTVAVEVGLMLACVFFIYRMSTLFRVEPPAAADAPAGVPAGVEIRELFGALFFGAVGKLEALPAQLPEGTRTLVLDLHRLISMDTSGLEALEQLRRVLAKRGITLRLAAVNEQPRSLMERAGFAAHVGEAAFSGTLAEALSASRAAGS